MEFKHEPVMLEECIRELKIEKGGIYVDGTIGGAGHSHEIAKELDNTGMLIGIDRDEEALEVAKSRLKNYSNIKYVYGNHDEIKDILSHFEVQKVNGILLDLGVSSYQLDNRNRGFSYMSEESILDMRMDKGKTLTAKDVINLYSEEKLYKILSEYGEERFAKRIARNICLERKNMEITTTGELVDIIKKSIPAKFSKERTSCKKNISSD